MNKKELINSLTLEEKILLLTQGQKKGGYDQTYGIEHLGIKTKFMCDGPHGIRSTVDKNCTSFPNLCCAGASWDREMLYTMGSALADECKAHGVDLLLGPGANIKRHILCGRNFEYFSEDPVLSGEMAAAYINGLQDNGVGASLKHYAMNNQELHREYISVEADERVMREIYLKSFEIAVKKSSPVSVMCAYNKIDSVWCSENKTILKDILKDEWGYKGIMISDWGAVHDIRRAIPAGLDMQMPRNARITEQIQDGLNKGILTEAHIDEAVSRILDFVTKESPEFDGYDRNEQHTTAKNIAASGIVLLKNQNSTLPLNSDKYKKISVIGEFAASPLTYGQGSAEVYAKTEYIDSPLVCLESILGKDVIQYKETYKKREYSAEMLWPKTREFLDFISDSDAVVLFVGSMESEDTEKFDRRSARFNPNYEHFIDTACKTGKKVIVVIQSGSAMLPGAWRSKADAIVQMWLGGEGAGSAVADILTGKINPSGKLSETFPLRERTDLEYESDGLKLVYKEGFDVGYRYYDKHPEEIWYPFGHGLSYTDFVYSNLNITRDADSLSISFDLTNTGENDGSEVVQVYVGKEVSCVTRPIKELKAFEKTSLNKGESKTVVLKLDISELSYYNRALKQWTVEPGIYTFYIGSSSRDIRLEGKTIISDEPPFSVQQLGESMMLSVANQ